MPAKPSGEIKTRTIRQRQKNGDIYILERQTLYDPDLKYNKVLSTRLTGKIPKGSEIPVPTRPKRRKKSESDDDPEIVTASRKHVGMIDIIDHIGSESGIDDAIYSSTDIGTAQKIISLARYLLATNGQSLPGILTWQYSHPLPYEDGISEDVYNEQCPSIIQCGRAFFFYSSFIFTLLPFYSILDLPFIPISSRLRNGKDLYKMEGASIHERTDIQNTS